MNKLFLFGFIFLLVVPFSLSVPPVTQASVADDELTIIYPKNEYFLADVPIDFHIHIFNSSGYALNTSKVGCYIHIYNITNKHIFVGNFTQDSHGVDLKVVLNSSVMNVGIKTYIISCGGISPQIEQGFLSSGFEVTYDGNNKSEGSPVLMGFIVILPLLFGFLLLFWAVSLDAEEHSVLKIFLSLLSSLTIFLSFHFALLGIIRFYYFPELQDLIGSTSYWMIWVFLVILFYYIFYFIVKAFETARSNKIERLRY